MTASIKILFLTLSLYTLQSLYSLSAYAQLVSDFQVNDDTTNYAQYAAKVGCDDEGNFVVVWYDERTTKNPRICGQIFNQYAQRIGDNFQVNNDQYRALPSLHVRKNGSFIVAWSVIQTKFRIFNRFGTPVSDEIIVSDSSGSITSVGGDSSGNFVITWERSYSTFNKHIYCQLVDSTGKLLGNNTKVNDDTGNNTHKNPAITVRQDGSFIITWQDSRPPSTSNSEDIYMQMYSKDGNAIGSNVRVSDNTVLYDKQSDPKISSDTSGRFCISFTEFILNEVNFNVMCQLYNYDGTRSGNNFPVAGSIIDEFNGLIFKKENGDMVSGYTTDKGFRYISYFQRISSAGLLFGTRYPISNQAQNSDKFYNDITVWNDRIISIWQDNRNGNYDIYCNIRSYINPDSTTSIQNISSEIPVEFNLFQNYPNPFNTQTNIVFEVKRKSDYSLEIYNSLGSIVERLNYKNLDPGKYNISYDASGLSSGVYYYSMNSGSSNSVRKFIFLK